MSEKKPKHDFLFRDRKLIVIKFGGATLKDGQRLVEIAHRLAAMSETMDLVVVVSAMGDSTTDLIKLAHEATEGSPSASDTIEIAAHGEMISARALKAALSHIGKDAIALTPFDENWPIIAIDDSPQLLSQEKINEDKPIKIHEEETHSRVLNTIGPMLQAKQIPVLCGFLARDPAGALITLGRGGSDTTAFLVAKVLEADEVIIVTNVEGVLDADPEKVDHPSQVKYISTQEMDTLAHGGARVIHPMALAHKSSHTKARVTHFDAETYEYGGTEISGFLKATLDFLPQPLCLISVVLERGTDLTNINELVTDTLKANDIHIHSIASTNNYIGVYLDEESGEKAYKALHAQLTGQAQFKAIALKKGIARVLISSPRFLTQPGVIARVGAALALENINISDIISLQNDINIFVDWENRKKVGILLKRLTLDAAMEEFSRDTSA